MVQTKTVIDEGSESIVTLVNDDTASYVTKTQQPHGKTQYLFEAFAYEALKTLGSHVPTVISVSETKLTMSVMAGEMLDDKIELYSDASIFDSVAQDLALNRRVMFDGYGKAHLKGTEYVGEHDTWQAYLESIYSQIGRSTLFSDALKGKLQAKWNTLAPSVSLTKGMLVHGDFALSAIFVNQNSYEGIIDYGDAFIGDPLMDIAYFRFKEITKDYGASTYSLLADSYAKYTGIERTVMDEVTSFYMLYWGIVRAHADNLEPEIINKFIEKMLVALDIV